MLLDFPAARACCWCIFSLLAAKTPWVFVELLHSQQVPGQLVAKVSSMFQMLEECGQNSCLLFLLVPVVLFLY